MSNNDEYNGDPNYWSQNGQVYKLSKKELEGQRNRAKDRENEARLRARKARQVCDAERYLLALADLRHFEEIVSKLDKELA